MFQWGITLISIVLLVMGCGGAASRGPERAKREEIVEMDELRITASRKESGKFDFQVYDAAELFERATELLNQRQCDQAIVLYDKLLKEFSSSRFVSASIYNSALCLQHMGKLQESADTYSTLIERLPDSPDVKPAMFQVVQVLLTLNKWNESLNRVDTLLTLEDLTPAERAEAMSYRAKALFGANRLDEAERQARSCLSYYRTRPEDQTIHDEFFVAACNYILAETIRTRGQALKFAINSVEEERKVLIEKAELLLEAQREYFNTINFRITEWAAASGYRIGQMYDELWQSIMEAPIPEHLSEEGHEIYRFELAKLIKPLVRHSIRYWELTLMLIERTGLKSEWTEQTKKDLELARQRLLEQPPGPGGLPQESTVPKTDDETGKEPTQSGPNTEPKSQVSPGPDGLPKESTKPEVDDETGREPTQSGPNTESESHHPLNTD